MDKAIKYAQDVLAEKWKTNIYIKKLCKSFLDDLNKQEDESFPYFYNEKLRIKIENIMKLMNFATGEVAGKSTYESCADYQFFFIFNIFCWVHKDRPTKRRYETALLHIARKNSKTVNNALVMILLLLLEPKYSGFYLCANTREQAKLLYDDIKRIIENSPDLSDKFIIQRNLIRCKINQNEVKALSSDYNTTDGLRVSAAVIDEVGAAKDSGLIDSMKTGMLSVENRLLVLISTSYPNLQNPFLNMCNYSQKVLDKIVEDESIFPMLYTLDIGDEYTTENFIKANPLQATLKDGKEFLEKSYKAALEIGGDTLTNFYCKHLNKWVEGNVTERFVDVDKVRECKLEKDFTWNGKSVYLGLDLSQSVDLTAVSMVAYEDGNIYCQSWGFTPELQVDKKSKRERFNYRRSILKGECFSCGEDVIDYCFVEQFIIDIEKKFNVKVLDLGYDKHNAISSINKLLNAGITCTEVPQHSRFLHSGVKLLEESILSKKFHYVPSSLFEYNFGNCRVQYDTNMRKFLHKKRSVNHMIDLVVATVNALKVMEDSINMADFFIESF